MDPYAAPELCVITRNVRCIIRVPNECVTDEVSKVTMAHLSRRCHSKEWSLQVAPRKARRP